MMLRKLGHPLDQEFVFQQSAPDAEGGNGCYARGLASGLRQIGFSVGPVQAPVTTMQRQWEGVLADLGRGWPTIVCVQDGARERFLLLSGYSESRDQVLYHDPAAADGAYLRMPRGEILRRWALEPNLPGEPRWLARIRLEPGAIGAAARRSRGARGALTASHYGDHVTALRRELASVEGDEAAGYTIVVQPPFVVIGDETPQRVRSRARTTVKWAVDRLKQSYFARDPAHIIDVWLLRDRPSYERHTRRLTGRAPSTPYGFYAASRRALVMNIATGGGTLVHEMVHPFVEANFPGCPPWLNEGLGSLYERCGEEEGQIRGYVNWRLPGLQRALRAGQIPSFRALTAMDEQAFYLGDSGTNYGQARYLCYYLEQRGLLRRFYREFLANRDKDPTGYRTLQRVLGVDDMTAFWRTWKRFVLALRYEE